MGCKVIDRFFCVYVVAKKCGFCMGNIEVSCEHCLDGILESFGGTVIYKKRYKHLPPFEHCKPAMEKAGNDWIAGIHPLCGSETPSNDLISLKTPWWTNKGGWKWFFRSAKS